MLNFLPGPVIGIISFSLYVINTIVCASLLFPLAILKLVYPGEAWRNSCNKVLNELGIRWIAFNSYNLRLTKKIRWDVRGIDGLKPDEWYLVLSNHQSWVDILVLQKIFHRKIPFLKFFLKKELIWVPIMGLAWWALEFPFMKRYKKEYLEKFPQHKGKDLEITKKACERFRKMPISVMNFVEGTRFTRQKHNRQKSPYTNLLRPKAGGVAFVLSAMGDQFNHILDVTIVYPRGAMTFWEFMCTGTNEIIVRVEAIPVTDDLIGDYSNDPHFQNHFQDWLNRLWMKKDIFIDELCREKKKAA
ncbi:MAG TPA: acyltransferase [Deltaproteobacteria bacterium]|nr:acyltransferase [Deltaproteobacteria bacterium]